MLRIDFILFFTCIGSFIEADAMDADAAQFLADILRKQGNISKSNTAGISLPNTLQQAKKLPSKHKTVFYFCCRTLFLYASSIILNNLLSFMRMGLLYVSVFVSLIK